MVKESNGAHRKAIRLLEENPALIGIPRLKVLTASPEQVLFYRGKFFCRVDLVYGMKDGSVIIVEYKANGEKRLIEKGKSQLEKAVDFYQKIIQVPAQGRLVTGDSYPILKQIHLDIRNPKYDQKYINNSSIKKKT